MVMAIWWRLPQVPAPVRAPNWDPQTGQLNAKYQQMVVNPTALDPDSMPWSVTINVRDFCTATPTPARRTRCSVAKSQANRLSKLCRAVRWRALQPAHRRFYSGLWLFGWVRSGAGYDRYWAVLLSWRGRLARRAPVEPVAQIDLLTARSTETGDSGFLRQTTSRAADRQLGSRRL